MFIKVQAIPSHLHIRIHELLQRGLRAFDHQFNATIRQLWFFREIDVRIETEKGYGEEGGHRLLQLFGYEHKDTFTAWLLYGIGQHKCGQQAMIFADKLLHAVEAQHPRELQEGRNIRFKSNS